MTNDNQVPVESDSERQIEKQTEGPELLTEGPHTHSKTKAEEMAVRTTSITDGKAIVECSNSFLVVGFLNDEVSAEGYTPPGGADGSQDPLEPCEATELLEVTIDQISVQYGVDREQLIEGISD